VGAGAALAADTLPASSVLADAVLADAVLADAVLAGQIAAASRAQAADASAGRYLEGRSMCRLRVASTKPRGFTHLDAHHRLTVGNFCRRWPPRLRGARLSGMM
jgi:hypothetical protein